MKNSIYSALLILLFFSLGACSSSEDTQPKVPDGTLGTPGNPATAKPVGMVEVLRTGTFSSQSGSNTKGMIDLITDDGGSFFIKLGKDFNSSFHTGTVTIYLSTSSSLKLSEASSYQLVAVVNEGGEHYFKLPNFPDAKFSHGILWCGAAAIPFGFAALN